MPAEKFGSQGSAREFGSPGASPSPPARQAWGAGPSQPPARAGQAWGARLEAGASARARPWQPRGQSVVPARRRGPGRRAAVVPACRHDHGKLSTPYQTSKIHHIFVRLPTKFGVIPSRFLFYMNFGIFNGRKIKINNSRFLKIREKILQLDWIFPSLCAKFQLQIIFFEGFRGGGPAGT